jgi:hypothetical protein
MDGRTYGCLAVFPRHKGRTHFSLFFFLFDCLAALIINRWIVTEYDYSFAMRFTQSGFYFLNNSFVERLEIRLVLNLTTSVSKFRNFFNLKHFKQSATGKCDGKEGPATTAAPPRFIK